MSKIIAAHGFLIVVFLAIGITTLTLKSAHILSLLAAATTSLIAPSTLYFTPSVSEQYGVGQTFDIDVNVNARVPINAIGTTIKFPEDSIDIVGVSKARSFLDLWTEETAIKEDAGEIHFSGGTTDKMGLVGTGTALTLTVRTKRAGEHKIYFSDASVYASDGKGTELESSLRSFTFTVPEAHVATAGGASAAAVSPPLSSPPPNPDLNEDGKITIVDISIMITRMVLPYDPRFDLDRDGSIGLSDLSIVLSKVNQAI